MGEGEGHSLSFTEHLDELRGRILICLAALLITTLASLPFADDLLKIIARPLDALATQAPTQTIDLTISEGGDLHLTIPPELDGGVIDPNTVPLVLTIENASGESQRVVYGRSLTSRPYYFNLTDPILLIIKAAILLGVCVAMPLIAWQAWLFVAPGLTTRERSLAKPIILLAAVLFPIGVTFAFVLLHLAVRVLTKFAFGDLTFLPDVSLYVKFALRLMFAFGVVFEMPAIMWLLARVGVVNSQWLAKQRRYAIVLIFVVAAIMTPPDIVTQIAMAVPLLGLFELSILLVRLTEGRRGA